MVISLKQYRLPILGILALTIVSVTLCMVIKNKAVQPVMGGFLYGNDRPEQEQSQSVFDTNETGGDDVLLHENIQHNGQWKEVNLLRKEHQVYKFSILNPNLVLVGK